MVRMFGLARPQVARIVAIGAFGVFVTAGVALAQTPAPPNPTYMFPGGAGFVLNFIKPDKAADWEGLIDKIITGLKASEKAERQAQGKSWKIFKAAEQPVKEAVLYIWLIEEAPKDTEYSMVKILTELFPKEANQMYMDYSACYQPPAQQFFHMALTKDYTK
jgi:hypothetical protein